MPAYHVLIQPTAKYLPDGPAPRSAAEEIDRLLGVLPDYVAAGPFATWVARWDGARRAWGKLPLDPLSPERCARATDPHTCGTLEQAVATRFRFGLAGICRLLVAGERIVGGDVDHVDRPAPELAPRGAYVEESPSGHGVRFFLQAAFPECGRLGRRRGDVELYCGARFLSVTARVLQSGGDADPIDLARWYDQHFPPPPVVAVPGRMHDRPPPLSDHELLERARAARGGDRFSRLWAGDTSLYAGDHSRADLALCGALHFWTNGDRQRIDSLFRCSGLYRAKWDQARGDRTYGQRTVDHVCALGAAR